MKPVRLAKVEEMSLNAKIERFALKYAHIIVPAAIIILMILFVALAYAMIGVSATESGTLYNHLGDL